MKQKLKNNKGMTLVEMLCTVVIVVIMSALLATGIALATSHLSESVTASEAKVLCDTLTTKLCYYINRDGLSPSYITIDKDTTNQEGTEEIDKSWSYDAKPCTAVGQILWRESKLVPFKTYPSMAGAKVTLSNSTWESGQTVTVTVTVCNRITGREYCHDEIRVLVTADSSASTEETE